MIKESALRRLDAGDCKAVFDRVVPRCSSDEFGHAEQFMEDAQLQFDGVGKRLAFELFVKVAACLAQLLQ